MRCPNYLPQGEQDPPKKKVSSGILSSFLAGDKKESELRNSIIGSTVRTNNTKNYFAPARQLATRLGEIMSRLVAYAACSTVGPVAFEKL